MILIKFFLTGVLYDCFKLTYAYLSEGDKVSKCYRSLKMIVQAHLHLFFFAILLIKCALLKRFYLCMKLLQSSITFKEKK